ncbi:hypothetical protein VVR12_09180 [Rothia sp. LK2588]|uniref:hypothetical protein n=1 Tax=Rothia sp. LK2588 TaxID=3114369 RepID=UPI0034CEBA70
MTTQQNFPGNHTSAPSPYIEPHHARSKWLTVALWGVYAALAFLTWGWWHQSSEDQEQARLIFTAVSTLSFAVGNVFALIDTRKNTPWIAWRPAYTAVGIAAALFLGWLFNSLATGGIFGICAIILMRALYGPSESKRQRTAKDIGV